MNSSLKPLLLCLLFLTISCQRIVTREIASDHAISQSTQQLVTWETKANAVSLRSDEVITIFHYEIPLHLLESDLDLNIDKSLKDSLVFTKNGEKYIRWVINPEDTKWHLEIKKLLDSKNLDSDPKKFFDGYLTASRSMILVNPENGASFSLKVSTNHTGGNWTDKKQTWEDAKQVRRMNKWVNDISPKIENEHLIIMNEPGAFGIKDLDQAMIMRSLNDLPKDGHFYMPAFSVLHEEEGLRIAKLNGATDPVAYWDKNLIRPLANAMAEYFAMTGSWYDSPHAQNFLIELDSDMKPTGKIVFRDLGDAYLIEDFVKNTKYASVMQGWEKGKIIKDQMITAIGLLHGNSPPRWLTALEYKEYGWNFYRIFEKRFSEISGIPLEELSKTDSKELLFSYIRKTYPTTSDAWKRFFKYAQCLNGEIKTSMGEICPEKYIKRHKKKFLQMPRQNDCIQAVNIIMAH